MNDLAKTPLSLCDKGHELQSNSDYLYRNNGQRDCRQCVLEAQVGKKRKTSFKGSM